MTMPAAQTSVKSKGLLDPTPTPPPTPVSQSYSARDVDPAKIDLSQFDVVYDPNADPIVDGHVEHNGEWVARWSNEKLLSHRIQRLGYRFVTSDMVVHHSDVLTKHEFRIIGTFRVDVADRVMRGQDYLIVIPRVAHDYQQAKKAGRSNEWANALATPDPRTENPKLHPDAVEKIKKGTGISVDANWRDGFNQ
jgi:hypothetical protein